MVLKGSIYNSASAEQDFRGAWTLNAEGSFHQFCGQYNCDNDNEIWEA